MNQEHPENPKPSRRGVKWGAFLLALVAAAAVVWPLGYWPLDCGTAPRPGPMGRPPFHVAVRPRLGETDVTFFVTADTHYGGWTKGLFASSDIAPVLRDMIEAMNAMPGRRWPGEIGGVVARPAGVLVAGDLTDNGSPEEWAMFAEEFGRHGWEGRLKFPVFEGIGNHDMRGGDYVKRKVAARHGGHYQYSWDWNDLHLINVCDGPDEEGMEFLARDLAANGRERPVIVYLHYPLAGRYSQTNWFGDDEHHERFADALDGYNVIGVFHGHYHSSGHYTYRGLDVYNVGSASHLMRSFAVVRVTDDRLSVASWFWPLGSWSWSHSKAINRPSAGATTQPAWRK